MSALERLTAYLCSRPGTEDMDAWRAEWAEGILRMHAHELAERLRASEPTAQLVGLDTAGLLAAADLIDPEVS